MSKSTGAGTPELRIGEGSSEGSRQQLIRLLGIAWLAGMIRRWRWPFAILLMGAACIYAFWWLRLLVRPWNDFAFVYSAGRSWLGGFSPYDFDRWNAEWAAVRPIETHVAQPMPFMYPPHWGPIAIVLGVLSWPVAARLWDAVNVFAFIATCVFSMILLGGPLRTLLRKPAIWVFLAIATFNPALRYSMFQSQMTLVPTLGIVGAFWAWREQKTGWLVVFAFVASLKPQLSLVALLYLLLNGGHLGVLWAGAAAAGVGLLSMIPAGLAQLPAQLANCYGLHMQLDFNQPKEFFNLPALLAGHVSGHAFMIVGPCLAVMAVLALSWMRRQRPTPSMLDPLWQLSVVVAITGALMPVHGYDLVIYTPLAVLAYRLRARPISLVLISLILFAGRPGVFAVYLHLPGLAPVLTGAMMLTALTAGLPRFLRALPIRLDQTA